MGEYNTNVHDIMKICANGFSSVLNIQFLLMKAGNCISSLVSMWISPTPESAPKVDVHF
jgi:hypothetical protein